MLNKKTKMLAVNLILILCFLTFLPSLARSTVTVSVGYATGLPGDNDTSVAVSMENQEQVKGVQVDICDADDYLTCTSCETTDRSADLQCGYNELTNGCFRVILMDFIAPIAFIEAGDSPILTIKCNVSGEAPTGQCADLTLEEVRISDVSGNPLPSEDVTLEHGLFGFCDNCSVDTCNVLIELSSFTATPKSGKVIVAWSTESEIDNAGFNVYRAESEDGEYTLINDSLIPAEGSPTEGADYELIDKDVRNRKTYYYKLEDIDINGESTFHDTASATPRLIYGFGK